MPLALNLLLMFLRSQANIKSQSPKDYVTAHLLQDMNPPKDDHFQNQQQGNPQYTNSVLNHLKYLPANE